MQILIDVSDKVFDHIKEKDTITSDCIDYITSAILYGTIIPNKHGDLIDRDLLIHKIWDVDCRCGYVQVVDRQDIEDSPTIIPADTEVDNDRD